MLHAEVAEAAHEEEEAPPPLLLEFLDATRSSLWVLDPERFQQLRSCVDVARRWGELAGLKAFWSTYRIAEDASIEMSWFDAKNGLGDGLGLLFAPEPPFVLAAACTGTRLDATQQHAALPPGRIDLLFDPTRPACHRWLERQLDSQWHASFLSAREILRQLPERLDDSCRASLTDWLYEHRRAAGQSPDPIQAADLFELWAYRYFEEWRDLVIAELRPLAEYDAQLVVFTDD
ncbi:MAG TPA: hypothetical protein VNO30_12200 [Kofleriaceae bacterium]|nr:hypothetical protein [Kofleriaceae bacterium]